MKRTTMFLTTGLSLALFFMPTQSADSQGCCPLPNSEISGVQGQQYPGTLTEFNMSISDAQSTNFDDRQIQEGYGNQGSNSCYYPGSSLPQQPAVYNPQFNVPPWVVGRLNDNSSQHNHWGFDLVGLLSEDIDQIRRDRPDLLPCQLAIYQNMWIECDASTHIDYEQNNVLLILVYGDRVQNCRYAMLDNVNRCETLSYSAIE